MSQLPFSFDCHTHTKFSDGRNTVEQNARMAQANGLDALAFTDHFFGPDDAAWTDAYLAEIRDVQANCPVTLLAGVEATILDADGSASIMAGEGVRITLGSDAHSAGAVGNLAWSVGVFHAAGVPGELLVRPEEFATTSRGSTL